MSTLVLRCGSVFDGLSDVLPGTTEDAERVLNTLTPALGATACPRLHRIPSGGRVR